MKVSFHRTMMTVVLLFFCLEALSAEPFNLASGQVIEVREVRRVRGVIEWVNPVGRVTIPTPWGNVSAVGTIYLYPSKALKEIRIGWGDDVAELSTPHGKFLVRETITFHPNGQIASVKLKNLTSIPTSVGTVSAVGSLTFHPGGELESVFIPAWRAALITVNGARYQVRDGLTFHPNGTVKEVTFHQPDQAILETPVGRVAAAKAWFQENGSLRAVNFASEETQILGHRCRSASWYPNGRLSSLELVGTVTMETPMANRLVSGLVEWHPNGRPKSFTFEGSLPTRDFPQVGRLTLKTASFDENGALIEAGLEKIQAITTAVGRVETDYLQFFSGGALRSVSLSKQDKEFIIQTPLGGLSAGWFLSFYDNGQLHILSFKPLTVHSVRTPLGVLPCTDSVEFYPSGRLKSVVLSTARRLQTPSGVLTLDKQLEFFESGTLKSCQIRGELKEPIKTAEGNFSAFRAEYDPYGNLRELTLAQDSQIRRNSVGEFSILRFGETGNLEEILPPQP